MISHSKPQKRDWTIIGLIVVLLIIITVLLITLVAIYLQSGLLSDTPVKRRAEFMSLADSDDLVAIYMEREFGTGMMVYYAALSASEYSLVFLVYEFRPVLRQVDNGFLNPKSYEML